MNPLEQQPSAESQSVMLEALTAVELAMEGISKLDDTGRYVFVNQQYAALLGYRQDELVGQSWEITVHPDDRPSVLTAFVRMLEIGKAEEELRGVKKDGSVFYKHVVLVKQDGSGKRMAGHFCFLWDVTERKRIEALQDAEKQTLELVAKGTPLNDVLTFMCHAIEAVTEPLLCSVMLVSKDQTALVFSAGPSLPEEYTCLLTSIPIGPAAGSCGTAAYHGTPIIAEDITVHPLWGTCAHVALRHGLRACWSLPIKGSTGRVLGTFAAYYREPRAPQPADLRLVDRVSSIAALAIQHASMLEAIKESEARFDAFMRYSPAVTFIKDSAGHYVYVNPKFETLAGLSRQEAERKTVFDFLPADIATRFSQNDKTVLASGQMFESEELLPAPDGTVRDWLTIKFPLEVGQRPLLGGMAVDITDRKRLERANQDQAHRLRLAMDMAKLATWDWNILTNQVIWSENCEEVKGLPHGSFDGTFEAYQRVVHPEDLPRLLADIESALSGRQSYRTEHRIVPPIGEVQWVEGNGVVYRDELGRPIRMVGTVRNITEQKRMEQAMRLNEERYARATAVGKVGVWELDVQAGTYYGDTNLKAIFGYQPDELSTDPLVWLNLVHPDDQSIAMAQWQRIVGREVEEYNYEIRMLRKDGTVIWSDIRGHALRDGDGQLTHVIGATLDITTRKQSEMSLLRTQFAMDQAVDAVYWIDPQAKILYTNEAASTMLGYTKEEFLRMTVHDLNPDFPAEVWPGWWEEVREKKVVSLETNHLTRDGRLVPIDIRVVFLAYGGQEFHCAYVRDITARKHVDQALHESQTRFELAVSATYDGIWDWNILTGEQYWSDHHLELFGLRPGDLTPTYDLWLSLVHPDDAGLVHQATCRHLETREPYDIEVRVRMKDGSYRWFHDRGQAVWDESGRPVRMVGSITDVTARRQAEEAI
jgi:PAS domain S-box-containing protein